MVLRWALGFVYALFGLLKLYPDLSPAELLSGQIVLRMSAGWIGPEAALRAVGGLECAIALGLLMNAGLRWVAVLFFVHMLGTFAPLVVFPELTFKIAPFAPTLEGQYILKNMVFLAAGWTIFAPHLGLRSAESRVSPR